MARVALPLASTSPAPNPTATALERPARLAASATASPACVSARAEVRYANYGYDHYVVVTNGCATLARCEVTTDVAPAAASLSVPPGESRELLTFRGSPASEFHAKVGCRLGDAAHSR